MSPSLRRRRAEGMPWTTSSLIEMQTVAGKPRYPLNAGVAPRSRMNASTTSSISRVDVPALASVRRRSTTSARMRPPSRMSVISRSDL